MQQHESSEMECTCDKFGDCAICSIFTTQDAKTLDKIIANLNSRFDNQFDSRHATDDEVRIAWLLTYIDTCHEGMERLYKRITSLREQLEERDAQGT